MKLLPTLLALLVLSAGCRTSIVLNVENGTNSKVSVRTSSTGKSIEIAPRHKKKVPSETPDLLVTAEGQGEFRFIDVTPIHVESKFSEGHGGFWGSSSMTLNIYLNTNMQVFVLMPGKKSVNTSDQPSGYPKTGQKIGAQ